jgi:hypothetical protein
MRRIVTLSLLGLAAGLGACSTPDLVHPTDDPLYAGVRFINAVPDTAGAFGIDFRFVDLLESNAQYRVTFRNTPGTFRQASGQPTTNVSTAIQYKGAREGSRHFRVFLDDTLQSVASTILADQTVTLVTQHNYTAMLWGNARSAGTDAMRLDFWEESEPAPADGKVKLRVINATGTAIDAWAFVSSGTPAATPTWAAVAPYSASNYVEVDSGTYSYQVQNAGSGTNLFGNTTALYGQPPNCDNQSECQTGQQPDIEAAPGTRVSGSAISGIVFPASVPGSLAAQFGNPGISYVWDRRPPRTCDPYC